MSGAWDAVGTQQDSYGVRRAFGGVWDSSGNFLGVNGNGTTYGVGASYTWATLPAASTLSGVMVFVSDIGGGTYWRSNGTNWKPINGRYTHYKPTARQTSAAAAETLLDRVLFPAGLLQTGFVISNRVTTSKSSTTETATLRFKFGTLGTTGDTQLYTSTNLATTNVSAGVLADFKVASATTIQKIGSASTTTAWNGPNTSAYPAAITVSDVSVNACYLDITVQKDAGAETFALEDWVCEVVAPTV